jgi:hypothetical protein
VPLAKKTHKLATYSCPPHTLTNGVTDDELWEVWDPTLNVLLPHEAKNLEALVVRGKYGLISLVGFLEHLVHDRHLDAGLLEGKVMRLMQAIDWYHFCLAFSARHADLILLALLKRLPPNLWFKHCQQLVPELCRRWENLFKHRQLLPKRFGRREKQQGPCRKADEDLGSLPTTRPPSRSQNLHIYHSYLPLQVDMR